MWGLENKNKEPWQLLCERVAAEHDPGKFAALVQELNAALKEKERLDKAGPLKAAQSKPSHQEPAK
jgi:hypothetical protein